jgi:hypothetical protein
VFPIFLLDPVLDLSKFWFLLSAVFDQVGQSVFFIADFFLADFPHPLLVFSFVLTRVSIWVFRQILYWLDTALHAPCSPRFPPLISLWAPKDFLLLGHTCSVPQQVLV